jgi:hypothetical protein
LKDEYVYRCCRKGLVIKNEVESSLSDGYDVSMRGVRIMGQKKKEEVFLVGTILLYLILGASCTPVTSRESDATTLTPEQTPASTASAPALSTSTVATPTISTTTVSTLTVMPEQSSPPATNPISQTGTPGSPTSVPSQDHPPEQGAVSLLFTTIVQGRKSGGEGGPSLKVVQTDAQRSALTPLLSSQDQPALAAVDLSSKVVIAAFLGLKPTTGYGIEILTVEVSDGLLEVTVKSSAPRDTAGTGFEFPYHLVEVERDAFETHHPNEYRLREVSGELLAEGTID